MGVSGTLSASALGGGILGWGYRLVAVFSAAAASMSEAGSASESWSACWRLERASNRISSLDAPGRTCFSGNNEAQFDVRVLDVDGVKNCQLR